MSAKKALENFQDITRPSTLLEIKDQNGLPDDDKWADAYYANSSSSLRKLAKHLIKLEKSAAARLVNDLADQSDELTKAREEERALEKAAKAARAAQRLDKAANVTENGVKLHQVSREEFESLSTALSGTRAEYVDRIVEQYKNVLSDLKLSWAKTSGEAKRHHGLWKWSDVRGLVIRWEGGQFVWRDDADDAVVKEANRRAASSFDSYVVKLIQKIGKKVSTAVLTGNLWNDSVLTVRCSDGEEQKWNTRVIVNVSIRGKLFNQWPTTRNQPGWL